VLLDARFSSPQNGWLENAPFTAWSNGAFRLAARQPTRFVAIGAPLVDPPADLVVSATLRKVSGPPGGGCGIIVRDQGPGPRDGANQDGKYYVLAVGDRGDFGIWRRDGDRWVDLVAWTRSAAVRPGGSPNELVVSAIGDRLVFLINGTEVADQTDSTLPTGGVGVFVGGDANEVALDRFTVQTPD
jgi:hypothetical protein